MAHHGKIIIQGLEKEVDRRAFSDQCGSFWMSIISEKISGLPLTHKEKLEFADDVIAQIYDKEGEGDGQSRCDHRAVS